MPRRIGFRAATVLRPACHVNRHRRPCGCPI